MLPFKNDILCGTFEIKLFTPTIYVHRTRANFSFILNNVQFSHALTSCIKERDHNVYIDAMQLSTHRRYADQNENIYTFKHTT